MNNNNEQHSFRKMDDFLKFNTISELICCLDDDKTKEKLEGVMRTALLDELKKDEKLAEYINNVLKRRYTDLRTKIQNDVYKRDKLKEDDKKTKVKYMVISSFKLVKPFVDIFELRKISNPVLMKQFEVEKCEPAEKKDKLLEWVDGVYDIVPLMAVVGDGSDKLNLFADKKADYDDVCEVLRNVGFGRYGHYMIFKKIGTDPHEKFFDGFYEKLTNPHGIVFRGPKSRPRCEYDECDGFYVSQFDCDQ